MVQPEQPPALPGQRLKGSVPAADHPRMLRELLEGKHASTTRWVGLALLVVGALYGPQWPAAPCYGAIACGTVALLTRGLVIFGWIPGVIWTGREREAGGFLILAGTYSLSLVSGSSA